MNLDYFIPYVFHYSDSTNQPVKYKLGVTVLVKDGYAVERCFSTDYGVGKERVHKLKIVEAPGATYSEPVSLFFELREYDSAIPNGSENRRCENEDKFSVVVSSNTDVLPKEIKGRGRYSDAYDYPIG